MTWQVWAFLAGAVSSAALGTLAVLRGRMRVYRWYCSGCKRVVSAGRFHPGQCRCGGSVLLAYFCTACGGWKTSPSPRWHCEDCSSSAVVVGAEYRLLTALWRWRHKDASES